MATTATIPVDVDYPTAGDTRLQVSIGPARLRIKPGGTTKLVTGTYTDPNGVLPLRVSSEGGRVLINQDPEFRGRDWSHFTAPTLELELGTSRAIDLELNGGANDCTVELGGVPLRRLVVHLGADKAEVDFSAPNPVALEDFEVAIGAAKIDLGHLANANFSRMRFSAGAGGCVLDFGGELKRDAEVALSAGMSGIEVRIPASTAAEVRSESMFLGGIEPGGGFTTRDGGFLTPPAMAGSRPVLTVRATMALGKLELRTT